MLRKNFISGVFGIAVGLGYCVPVGGFHLEKAAEQQSLAAAGGDRDRSRRGDVDAAA